MGLGSLPGGYTGGPPPTPPPLPGGAMTFVNDVKLWGGKLGGKGGAAVANRGEGEEGAAGAHRAGGARPVLADPKV